MNSRLLLAAFAFVFSLAQTAAVLSVLLLPEDGDFEEQAAVLECYVHRHRYGLVKLDPDATAGCTGYADAPSRKHCAVATFLKEHPETQWIAALDASDLMARGGNSFQSFLPKDEDTDLVLMESLLSGELAASNFLAKNTPWTQAFLLQWAAYGGGPLNKVPADFGRRDTAALHMLLLDTVAPDYKQRMACMELLETAASTGHLPSPQYDKFLGCIKCAFGGQRVFPHIRILRRGQGFAREAEASKKVFPTDVIVKGVSGRIVGTLFSRSVRDRNCKAEIDWEPPLQNDLRVSLFQAQILTQAKGIQALQAHPGSLGVSDVSDCWPLCTPQFNGTDMEKSYRTAICPPDIAQANVMDMETLLAAADASPDVEQLRQSRPRPEHSRKEVRLLQPQTRPQGHGVDVDQAVSMLEAITATQRQKGEVTVASIRRRRRMLRKSGHVRVQKGVLL